MIKGILIDLGNTIVYNKNFNFNNGLMVIYNNIIEPKISYQELIKFTDNFKLNTYDIRDRFEICFLNYLNYLQKYFDLKFKVSLSELEYLFTLKVEDLELIDGVIDFLKYLKESKKKVVILSNSTFSSLALKRNLEDLGILDYFDQVLSSGDLLIRKPYTEFFNLGIKVLNLPKEEIMYIGNDYYFDVHGANLAGLDVIWLNEKDELNKDNLKVNIFKNYQEITKYIKERG